MGAPNQPTGLAPGAPSLPGPTVPTLTPTLTWTPSSAATSYSVAVLQVGGGAVLAQSVSAPHITPPALQANTAYEWSVTASNSDGSSAPSAAVYFTAGLPPPAPTGLTINGQAVNSAVPFTTPTLTLAWNPSPGATQYAVIWRAWNPQLAPPASEPTPIYTSGVVVANSLVVMTGLTGSSQGNDALGGNFLVGPIENWRFSLSVQAANAAGASEVVATPTFMFDLSGVPLSPPVPSGLTPGAPTSSGATVTTLTPTLSWTASPGATLYSVTLSQAGNPASAQIFPTTSTSIVCPLPLQNGEVYSWSVSAANSAGASAESSVVYFNVSLNVLPSAPTGLTPGAPTSPGATVMTLTPTLTWTGSSSAQFYSVSLQQVGGGAVPLGIASTNSVVCPALVNGATYQWSVSASNSTGSSAASVVEFFTVILAITSAPQTPSGLNPGETTPPGTSLLNYENVPFSWQTSVGATQYTVSIEEVSGATLQNWPRTITDIDQAQPFQEVPAELAYGKSYKWWVMAANSFGSSTSAVMYFTCNLPSAPPVPTGLSPGGPTQPGTTVTTLTPTLTWSTFAASGSSVLVEQVAGPTVLNTSLASNVTLPPAISLAGPTTVTNSIVCPTLINGATYRWVVTASNLSGSSAPSAVAYFTVQLP